MVISQQQIHVIRLNLQAAITVVTVLQLCLSVFVTKCLRVCVCVCVCVCVYEREGTLGLLDKFSQNSHSH